MTLSNEVKANFKNRFWRLNNLYYIKDKRGKKIKFRMNPEQLTYYTCLHNRNIILKARQLGFTTQQCIIQLDAALFESAACALIADNLDNAKRLFREKVKFAYDNLPELIKQSNPAKNDRSGELVFANGGYMAVSTSFRGGTLKYLHVSEFGKICAKYPDKAKEIVTGAFEAVSSDCYVTIESTAEGREGYFFDYCAKAQKDQDNLTNLDWKFFFFPWFNNPDYSLESGKPIVERLKKYFLELEQKLNIRLTQGQKSWYQAKEADLGEDMQREYPATPEEAFKQSIQGAYYAEQFRKIYKEKRIGELPANDHLDVFTFWDIGVNDSTAIWFVRIVNEQYHLIDYYENSGEGLAHYMQVIHEKGYVYAKHYGPHDIENREFGSNAKSRRELAREGIELDGVTYSLDFDVVPKTAVSDGIEAARQVLPNCYFDEAKTDQGIKCLENYKKEYNDKTGAYKKTPLHNWASNGADAFRYFAVMINNIKQYATADDIDIGFY